MGLGNIVSTVLTKYKADTSDQRKEIKKLKGEEKKRHEALVDQTDKQNAKLDSHIAMWGKVAVGIGAAMGAAKLLSDGFDNLQKNTALRAGTVGVSLKGLRTATQGLVDDTRLLEFASSAMNSTWKVSQSEMETALRGTIALRNEGKDLGRVLDGLEKSLTEGTTEPLKEFGRVLVGQDKLDAPNDTKEGMLAAVRLMSDAADDMGGKFGVASGEIDDMTRAGVELDNASSDMKDALGEIALALTPVISGFARMLSGAIAAARGASAAIAGTAAMSRLQQLKKQEADLKGKGSEGRGARGLGVEALAGTIGLGSLTTSGSFTGEFLAPTDRGALEGSSLAVVQGLIAKEEALIKIAEGNAAFAKGLQMAEDARAQAEKERADKAKGRGRRGAKKKGPLGIDPDMDQAMIDAIADGELRQGGVEIDGGALASSLDSGAASLQSLLSDFAAFEQAQNQNMLATIFGTPAEIDATAQALMALNTGVNSFTDAFGTGVAALIDGTDSFANAFKSALGESLKAMAVDFSMQALRHGLFALGSLAFGDFRGAAKHGAAAAAYGAGAVAAGAAAREFGVGQSAQAPPERGGGSAGAAGVGAARPGSAANGNRTRITIFDDDFASMSARERQSRLRKRARSAGFDIEGDVVVNG